MPLHAVIEVFEFEQCRGDVFDIQPPQEGGQCSSHRIAVSHFVGKGQRPAICFVFPANLNESAVARYMALHVEVGVV